MTSVRLDWRRFEIPFDSPADRPEETGAGLPVPEALKEEPMTATAQIIRVELPEPFDPRWNRISGVTVEDNVLTIDPQQYFFRYTNPSWVVCDWDGVRTNLLDARETSDVALEQMALDYVKAHGRVTHDPAEVLTIAWQVNAWLFREEHLDEAGLQTLGVQHRHLQMLREASTIMALNRVELTGEISNVGHAWMFADAVKVVYDLDDAEAAQVDELYHGTWFNENRRLDAVRANTALGGRLVHGCQSTVDMRGGCIVPFGADLGVFRQQLADFGDDWIERVQACGK